MTKENDEEKNHFLDLVETFGDVIEEKHLEMLLKSQLDSLSQAYFWLLTVFFAVGTTLSATKIVIDPSSILGYVTLGSFIVVTIALYMYGRNIKKIDLLEDKKRLVEKFLIAKRRLNNKGSKPIEPLKKKNLNEKRKESQNAENSS